MTYIRATECVAECVGNAQERHTQHQTGIRLTAMTTVSAAIPIVTSVAELGAPADAWICDIWGVLHNGVRAFESAVAACIEFRAGGGVILLLSNAPRPHGSVIAQMLEIGVPANAYDAVVTSGDLTRRLIADRRGVPLFHLGPARDRAIFDDLDVTFAAPGEASFVICSGYYNDDVESPADYADMLAEFKSNGALMVCANPDIMVERGDRLIYCAGALAQAYEAIGGHVIYAGKPHLPAYAMALETIARVKGRKVTEDHILAIGDGLHTDMLGAANAGLRSVFVSSTIHVKGELDHAALGELFPPGKPRPIAAMTVLAL